VTLSANRLPPEEAAAKDDGTGPPTSQTKGEQIGAAAIVTLAGAAAGAVLVLAGDILAVRFLGAERYGFFALAFVIAKVCGMAAAFGLRISILHYLPQYLHDQQSRRLVGAVMASVTLPAYLGLFLTVLLWWTADWIAVQVFSMPLAAQYIRYAGFLIPLVALVEVLSHVPRAFGRSLEQVLVRNLVPPAAFVLGLTVLIMTEQGPLLVMGALILAHLLAIVLGARFVLGLLRRYAKGKGKPEVPWRTLYAYSVWVVVNDLLLLGVSSGDMLILAAFVEAEQVGLYRVCVQVGVVFYLLQHAAGAATAPVLPMLVRTKSTAELQEIYSMVLRCIAVVMLPGFWVMAVNARDILMVFDPVFASGSMALQLKAAAMTVTCGLGLSGILLSVGGFPSVEMRNSAAAFVACVILNVLLIPEWGVDGAAAAALITAILITVLRIVQVRRLTGVKTLHPYLLRIAIFSGVLVFLIDMLLSHLGLPHGGGVGGLAARLLVAAAVTVLALGMMEINAEGRRNLRRIVMLRREREVSPSEI
jgi:O-antigen/teichoic acid export membrane protein